MSDAMEMTVEAVAAPSADTASVMMRGRDVCVY